MCVFCLPQIDSYEFLKELKTLQNLPIKRWNWDSHSCPYINQYFVCVERKGIVKNVRGRQEE